jgi:hypothetical protein
MRRRNTREGGSRAEQATSLVREWHMKSGVIVRIRQFFQGKPWLMPAVVMVALVLVLSLMPINREKALLRKAEQELDALPRPLSSGELRRSGTAKLNYVSAWRNYMVDAPAESVIDFYRQLAKEKGWRPACEPEGTGDWVLAYLDGEIFISIRNDTRYTQQPDHTRFDVAMKWEGGGPYNPCGSGGRPVE